MNDENGSDNLAISYSIKNLSNLLLVPTVHCIMCLRSQLAEKDSEIIKKGKEVLELKHLLEHEKTTGLFTRSCFDERLDSYERRSLDSGRKFVLVMIDLNFFKTINDTHGHHAGDEVLRVFGDIIRQRLRADEDIGCRWGGDEFVLLFEGVTEKYAESIVRKLMTELETADFSFNQGRSHEEQIHPTFSYGIAMQTHEMESLQVLLQKADSALYQSRRAQRR